MAVTVKHKEFDVWGSNKISHGVITSNDTTEATFSTGLATVEAVCVPHNPATLVTTSKGEVTFTPAATGEIFFIAIGR